MEHFIWQCRAEGGGSNHFQQISSANLHGFSIMKFGLRTPNYHSERISQLL
jgi:hypothetical protein